MNSEDLIRERFVWAGMLVTDFSRLRLPGEEDRARAVLRWIAGLPFWF